MDDSGASIIPSVDSAFADSPMTSKQRQAMQQLQKLLQDIKNQSSLVQSQNPGHKEISLHSKTLDSTVDALRKLLSQVPKRRGDSSLNDIIDKMVNQVSNGREAAIRCKDIQLRQDIMEACDELESLIDPMIKAIHKVLSNPDDSRAQRELQDLISKAREASNRLQGLLPKGKEFVNAGQELGISLDNLMKALSTLKEANLSLENLMDLLPKQIAQGKAAASLSQDPGTKRRILATVSNLEALFPALMKSGNEDLSQLSQNLRKDFPTTVTASAKKRSESVKERLNKLLNTVQARLTPIDIQDMLSEGKTGDNDVDLALGDIVDRVVKKVEVGRIACNRIKDPKLRKQILEVCDALEDLISPLVEIINEVFSNVDNVEAKAKLNEMLDKVTLLMNKLDKLIPSEFNSAPQGKSLEFVVKALISDLSESTAKKFRERENQRREMEMQAAPVLDEAAPDESISSIPDPEPQQQIAEPNSEQIDSSGDYLNVQVDDTIPTFFNLFDFEFLNSNIFNSDFFLLEIARLKTKYEYDNERRITGDTRAKQRVKYPKSTLELLKIAEREEFFATQFAEKFEYEWARMLIKHAMDIRTKVLETLRKPETKGRPEDIQKQIFQIEKNWEKYIFLCLKGYPASDTTEQGLEKTLELLQFAAKLTPIKLTDARCPQYVNLWENRVQKTLELYGNVYERQGAVDRIIETYLSPLIKEIPYYLDRNNETLTRLWTSTASIHDNVRNLEIQHGISSFRDYLLSLHQYFHLKINEDDSLPSVSEAFPLFTDVCRTLSNIDLKNKDWSSAQEFAVEEMMLYLEMDEEIQDDANILDAWDRILKCIQKIYNKTSDQFFLLNDVLQEISVYSNQKLKDRIQADMNSIGNANEVWYQVQYTEQLQKCARIFFGDMYDEIAEKLDNSSLLEEILANLASSSGPEDFLMQELQKLADLNYNFQFGMVKNKDYARAKRIIEENLMIRRYTNPVELTPEGASVEEKTKISYELLIDCCIELSYQTNKSTVAIQILTQCYEARPTYFPKTEKLHNLWLEMLDIKEFYQETLDSLYKKFSMEKRKLMETRIASMQKLPEKSGWVVMRINKTWQKRWFILQDSMLHVFKDPKSLRSRGIIPLSHTKIIEQVDPEIFANFGQGLVPGAQENTWIVHTPWRSYLFYTENAEEKNDWIQAIKFRQTRMQENNVVDEEMLINKEALARHPLMLDVLDSLGTLWSDQDWPEEALVLYIQGLELSAYTNNHTAIRSFWSTVYRILLRNKNIYEILEFLEEEKDRWIASGLTKDHLLMNLIDQSLEKITTEEDLKLRYMYQIRMYKELAEDLVPARVYFLNQIYSHKFLQNGSLDEAITLTKESLELLKMKLYSAAHADDLVSYYHMSTWHQLVDLYLLYAREKEKEGDFYGGRVLLQSAFENYPEKLDPFNDYMTKLVDEIYRLYSIDPETAPKTGASITDSTSFHWMYDLYLEYDDHLIKIYPSEALASRNTLLNFRKIMDRETLENKQDNFRGVIKKFPYMMNVCSKMGKSYFVAHQLENALHMARHTLHIMIASMPNRHFEIAEQWKLCKKYFMAQRHSNAEIKNFIEEEKLFASVFLSERHPHCIRVGQDLKKLESKIALYEKYIPAAATYLVYIVVAIILGFIGFNNLLGYLQWFTSFARLWLLAIAIYLDLGLLITAMIFVAWPPLPNDTLHRTSILLKRKALMKDVGLMIACHNSGEVLPQTLRAALHIFPPDHIFVCDNGNSSKPTDNSQSVCEKITREYQIQHGLPAESPKINYFYMSEGNKSLAFWYGAKYYCHFKYCMVIDDDVQLPPDLIIPMRKFKIPGTKVLAFTIGVENLHTHTGQIIYTSFWQDLEYKLAGYMKMFQSWLGTAILAHGAISLWERKTMMEVLWRHDTVFHGDDLQMGLILQKMGQEYRIDTVGNVNVPTTVPDHIVCPSRPWSLSCKCPGKDGNLLGQRVRSWDTSTHRFIGKFLTILIFHWDRTTVSVKPFILYELWSIAQDWIRVPMALAILIAQPSDFILVNLFFLGLAVILMLLFNFWVLRRRPDQQHPWKTLTMFPIYKLMTISFRFIAMWYNLLYYTPFIRNRQILGTRQDLPLGPGHIALIQSLSREAEKSTANPVPKNSHDWDTIVKLLNKEAQTSPALSHWFLSCISRLIWKKDNPRDKIISSSYMKKSKRIIGRTDRFFYFRTKGILQVAPASYLTALNVMCFLSHKSRCLGKDSVPALKILKWLWVEEKLGENIKDPEKVKSYLREFSTSAPKGISMFQFVILMREVVKPTLQFLDTSPQITANILHLQLAFEENWVLKSLALTSTDDRLIVRQYETESFKKVMESKQRMAVFVPLPSAGDMSVEPFKPSIVHAAILFDPSEEFVLVFNPQDELTERVYAVLSLLEVSTMPEFPSVLLLSSSGSLTTVAWTSVVKSANKFFENTSIVKSSQTFIQDSFVPRYDPLKFLFREDDECVVKRNVLTPSGFWLLPVIDILDGPILFLDKENKILDSDIYFEPYGNILPSDYKISTRPMSALKNKIMSASSTKFLATITQKKKEVVKTRDHNMTVTTFRYLQKDDNKMEFRLLKLNENSEAQPILLDFLAHYVSSKRFQKKSATKAFNKWMNFKKDQIQQPQKELTEKEKRVQFLWDAALKSKMKMVS